MSGTTQDQPRPTSRRSPEPGSSEGNAHGPVGDAARTTERGRVAAVQQRLLKEATVEIRPRRVRLDGGPTLQVLETGDGEPLVLLHGSGNSAVSMLPLIEQLHGRRVLAIDRPGHGLSEPLAAGTGNPRHTAVEVLSRLLDALELERVDLLGNSTGGFWSLWMALDRPHRVGRIVLVGATPLLPGTQPPMPLRLMTTPGVGDLMGRVMPEPSPASVKKMMATMGEGDTIARYPGLIDAFVAAGSDPIASNATQQELRAVIRGFRGFRPEFRFRETDLRRVRHPVLLIWGDRDPVGDVHTARQAAALLPNSHLEMLPTGHAPFWGAPARTSELVSRFLDDKPTT